MKNNIKKWILPVCLVIILISSLIIYIRNGTINFASIAVIFALTPASLKGIKPDIESKKYYKILYVSMAILAVIMLVMFGIKNM